MAISKIIKEGAKAVAKRGRKTKAQRAAETRKKNAAAKKAATTRAPKKKTAMKPGTAQRRATLGIRGNLKGLTTKQKRERLNLINQIKKEMEMAKKGLTKKETIQSRIPVGPVPKPKRGEAIAKGAYQEGPNTVLPSKIKLPEKLKDYSRAELRRLVKTGQARVVKTKDGAKVQTTGRFAPPASMIREAAGEGSRPIRTRNDTRTLGQKLKAAKRKGEPTSMEEVKKRNVEAGKAKTLGSKQAMSQAQRSIKKQQQQAVAKLNTKEMKQKAEISKAVKEGQITKQVGDNLKSKIEADFNKAKENIVESLRKQVHSTARKIKADPMQYVYRKEGGIMGLKSPKGKRTAERTFTKKSQAEKYFENLVGGAQNITHGAREKPSKGKPYPSAKRKYKNGGKISPRGCGAAMRGYGKAMKGGK